MSVPGPPAPASGGFPQRPSHVTGTVDLDRQPLVPGPGGGQIKPLEISTGGAPSDHNPTPLFPPAELELKLEELLVCAKTLKSRLPTMMEKALETIKTPLLVFHHRPKDGRGSTEANQNRKILEFLLVLVGVWKLEFPEENPDGVCLVLVDENKLVTAMALSMPYRNPESARMRPWEMACDWLNFFALVPPVTIFDPSKMTLNSLISSRGGPSTPATTSESTSYTSIPLAQTSEASGLAVLLSASEAMENKDSSSTSASASSSSSSSGAQSPSFQGKKEKEKPKLSVLKGIVKKKDSKPSWDRRSRSSSDSDSDSKSKASEFIYKEYQPGDQDSDSKRKRGQMTKKERAWHLTEILKGCAAFNPELHRTFQTYLFRPNENDPPRETDLHFFEGLRDSGLLVRKPLEPTVEKEIGEVYCITKDQESLLPLWKGRGLNPKQSISSALSRAFAHCHSYTLPLTVSGTLLIPPPTSPVTPPRANDPIPVPTPTAPTAVTSLPTESSTSNSKPDGEEVQKSC